MPDSYERRARLYPGLLAMAPIAFVIATLGLKQYPAVAIVVSVLSAAGGGYALSVLVGHRGRRAEKDLWSEWGGPPTTRFLRTREPAQNSVQRDAWRAAIQKVTGVALLSSGDEASDPAIADQTIEVAVGQMRLLTTDKRYPLVKVHNAQYGFQRNVFGLRRVGRGISIACVAVMAAVLVLRNTQSWDGFSSGAVIAGLVINFLFLVGWWMIPSAGRTKEAADLYALQLMQAVVDLSRQP